MKTKEEFVKSELSKFLLQYSPEASFSDVDDVVLEYMVSILEELGNSAASEDLFDVEQFTEMMEAYIPGFQALDSVAVSEWMFGLASQLDAAEFDQSASSSLNGVIHRPQRPEDRYNPDERSYPSTAIVSSDCTHARGECRSDTDGCSSLPSSCQSDAVSLLAEMFPTVKTSELVHCLSLAAGSLDIAAQHVLECMDSADELSSSPVELPASQSQSASSTSAVSESDGSLKKKIVAKYSYVDMDDDKKNYRPSMPKSEPKKMIRYLDSKVVSIKGERFTEIKKPEDESMKNTYVNLKPARQYRFH